MKKETRTISLGIAILIAAALGAKAIAAVTELARVNGKVISLQEFDQRYKDSLKYFQFKAPSKKSMLEEVIKREIGIQEAKKMGLERDPNVVDQMNTVLYQAFLNKKLGKQFDAIQVTDDEAKDWYDRNPEIRTSNIFILVRPDAKPADVQAAHERIKDVQAKLNGNMSFAEVAQKFSEGPSAQMGGDMNWQTRDHMEQAYFDAANKLSVGGVSSIVKGEFGYYIIKLTGKHSWDEVDRPAVKRIVFDERRQKIFENFMNQLRSQANVVVHSELLKD